VTASIHHMQNIKIKMEVDTNPPGLFNTEAKFLLHPIPFSVRSYCLPDLFAGKIHAILCRPWVARTKGRDWYDFVWYLAQNVPVNLSHLKERLIQSNAWKQSEVLDGKILISLLQQKIQATDFTNAKLDILPFIDDKAKVAVWSQNFFQSILGKICTVD
jgi:hypothetical protein